MPPINNTAVFTARGFVTDLGSSGTRLRESLAQIAVISPMVLSIASPPAIMWDPNSFYLKWEVAVLPVIFLIYAWLFLTGFVRGIQFNGMFAVGALYSIAVALSIWYGSVLLGQTVVLRDFYEFPKLWLPVAFFTLAYEAHLSEVALRKLVGFFAAALTVVCIYAWGQWEGLGFASWLDTIYVAPEHTQRALGYAKRVYSTMGNPNLLGMLMTWSISAFLLAAMLRVGRQTRNIGMLIICLATLAMTGSRYSLLTAGLAILLAVASCFASPRPRFSRLLLPLALLPLFASATLLVSNTNRRTLERFETLRAPGETDSFRARADQLWLDALDSFSQSPILGRGPAKTLFEGIVTDSEYLDVLKKFGLLGFISYLAYFVFPLFLIWRGMRAARRARQDLEERIPATFLVLRLGFVMVLTALVMNIGMSTFYNAILQGFLFLWMGLAASAARSIADTSLKHPSFVQMEPI
jgi:O-antigen ligase